MRWLFPLCASLCLCSCSPPDDLLGVVELTSEPVTASVFVHARYAGETDEEGPLRLTLEPGSHQLRVTTRGFQDLVAGIEVRAGEFQRLRAELAARGTPAPESGLATWIGTGQVMRGEFSGAHPDRVRRYVFEARAGQRRHLVVHRGTLHLEVFDPGGNEVVPTKESRPLGSPPELSRLGFTIERAGTWTIEVSAPSGAAGYFVFGLEKALSRRYEGDTPESTPRLQPGAPDEAIDDGD